MSFRERWREWREARQEDAAAAQEMQFHIEQETARNVRFGMSPESARRAAQKAFGGVDRFREQSQDERSGTALNISVLDFKLGFRMLVKYPGLTLIGGLAMAFAIWIGAGGFELVRQVLWPKLPLPDGDRIVGLQLMDAQKGDVERKALHDLVSWQQNLKSVEALGAFRTVRRNLTIAGLGVEPADAAEISASAFRLARVQPLMGRTLVDADEQRGAPAVAVIGYELWQRRFGGDPAVVGKTVHLARTQTTIVGVMPEGFGFPISHSLWVPLQLNVLEYNRRGSPAISIYGRLASSVSLEDAQAELNGLGQRAAKDYPDTHEHLRPQVVPYAKSIMPIPRVAVMAVASVNLILVLLVVLICGNVALLMFARAATRESEIVVRTALGASRGRIMTQLFAEALVLGAVAAAIGLAATSYGLRWALSAAAIGMARGGALPFWFQGRLSPMTIGYAVALTVLGALIAGVVPALKVTRGLQQRLREVAAGGGGLGFGGVWTVVIVAQVAVTVAFPFTAFALRRDAIQIRSIDVGFAADEYLTARVEMDRETESGATADTTRAAFLARYRKLYDELERRLIGDGAVAGMTYGDRLPSMYHPHRLVEVDEGGSAPRDPKWGWPGYRVSSANVDPGLFDAIGVPVLAGRGFRDSDLESGEGAVIVNQSFVDNVLGGHNPIGRRVRYIHFEEWDNADIKPGPWFQIVGVVRDMGNASPHDPKVAGFYHAATPEAAYPAQLALRVKGEPRAFAARLREIAAEVDPALRVYDAMPMDEIKDGEVKFLNFWFGMIAMVSALAILLSLAGIYAVMAFTVSRRTREIGVRVALGGRPIRIVTAILARPIKQVAAGIATGALLMLALMWAVTGGKLSIMQGVWMTLYSTFMMAVCMLACIVPTRRALRVQPTDALREA